jgi:hypothetical protein
MGKPLAAYYRRNREPLFVLARDTGGMRECRESAVQAMRNARVLKAWDEAGGDAINSLDRDAMRAEPEEFGGSVRLVVTPDNDSPSDDFDGTESRPSRSAEPGEP